MEAISSEPTQIELATFESELQRASSSEEGQFQPTDSQGQGEPRSGTDAVIASKPLSNPNPTVDSEPDPTELVAQEDKRRKKEADLRLKDEILCFLSKGELLKASQIYRTKLAQLSAISREDISIALQLYVEIKMEALFPDRPCPFEALDGEHVPISKISPPPNAVMTVAPNQNNGATSTSESSDSLRQELDIRFGRGGGANNQEANKRFLLAAHRYRFEYKTASRQERHRMKHAVVDEVNSLGLDWKKKREEGGWYSVPHKVQLEKSREALWERFHDESHLEEQFRLRKGDYRQLRLARLMAACFNRRCLAAAAVPSPQSSAGTTTQFDRAASRTLSSMQLSSRCRDPDQTTTASAHISNASGSAGIGYSVTSADASMSTSGRPQAEQVTSAAATTARPSALELLTSTAVNALQNGGTTLPPVAEAVTSAAARVISEQHQESQPRREATGDSSDSGEDRKRHRKRRRERDEEEIPRKRSADDDEDADESPVHKSRRRKKRKSRRSSSSSRSRSSSASAVAAPGIPLLYLNPAAVQSSAATMSVPNTGAGVPGLYYMAAAGGDSASHYFPLATGVVTGQQAGTEAVTSTAAAVVSMSQSGAASPGDNTH